MLQQDSSLRAELNAALQLLSADVGCDSQGLLTVQKLEAGYFRQELEGVSAGIYWEDTLWDLLHENQKKMLCDWFEIDAIGAGLLHYVCYIIEHDLFDGIPDEPAKQRGWRLFKLEQLEDTILKANESDGGSFFALPAGAVLCVAALTDRPTLSARSFGRDQCLWKEQSEWAEGDFNNAEFAELLSEWALEVAECFKRRICFTGIGVNQSIG